LVRNLTSPRKSKLALDRIQGAGHLSRVGLEGELGQRAWLTALGDEKLIFDAERDEVWDEAIKHRTPDL
jgi:putative AlgH/UPF0301 family transcriptional regulator